MTVVVDPPADAGSVPSGTTATRLGALDGLRAIAATFVFLYHGSVLLGSGSFMLRHWNVIGLFGGLGVSIFFVLSGFLLYRPFVRSMVADRAFPSILDFWTRRLFRIVPAYWVALTVLALLDRVHIESVGDGATYFGLVQNYRTGYADRGLDVAWSLVVEVSFYLVIPLFAWLVGRWAGRYTSTRARLQVALAAAVGWFVVGVGLRLWDIYWRQATPSAKGTWFGTDQMMRWLPGYLHWFAGGMVLAVVAEWIAVGRRVPVVIAWLVRWPALSWALAGGCVAAQVAIDVPQNVFLGTTSQALVLTLAIPLFATFLVLPAVLGGDRGLIRAGLRSAPLAWVGLVSYGLYLWHRPIQHFIIEHTSGVGARTGLPWTLARYALAVAASLTFAAASWYLVERPMIAVSRRLRPGRRRGHRGTHATTP